MTPVDGTPRVAGSNARARSPNRCANPACVRCAFPYADLHRAEELLLERVGGALVELLVRLAERGQRDAELVDRVGDRVEQLLSRFGGDVGHARRGYSASVDDLIDRALAEDVGDGDLTTRILVPPDARATARIEQKEPGVIAGLDVAAAVFERFDVKLEPGEGRGRAARRPGRRASSPPSAPRSTSSAGCRASRR